MKKVKVLALVLAFALAAMGGAYAMWADNLVINETVKTGYLDVQFQGVFNPDPGPNYTGYIGQAGNPYGVYGVTSGNEGLDELDPGNPNANKNIAKMDAALFSPSESGASYSDTNDGLTITLENGYPGYQDRIFTTIKNIGTVPAKLEITSNAGNIAGDILAEIWFDADPTKSKDNGEDFMVWNNSGLTPAIALDGYQIDPGESVPVAIYTRVLQAADQNDTYTYSINLKAIQWNEYQFALPNTINGTTVDRVDRAIDGVPQPSEPKFDPTP